MSRLWLGFISKFYIIVYIHLWEELRTCIFWVYVCVCVSRGRRWCCTRRSTPSQFWFSTKQITASGFCLIKWKKKGFPALLSLKVIHSNTTAGLDSGIHSATKVLIVSYMLENQEKIGKEAPSIALCPDCLNANLMLWLRLFTLILSGEPRSWRCYDTLISGEEAWIRGNTNAIWYYFLRTVHIYRE